MGQRVIRRLAHQIGRRGEYLLFVGLVALSTATSLADPPAATRASPAYRTFEGFMPLKVWAALWALVGLVCLVQAFRAKDVLAYVAAATLLALWAAVYAILWVGGDLPRGFQGAAIFGVFSFVTMRIGGWPERVAAAWASVDLMTSGIPDAVLAADSHGIIRACNPAAEAMFGRTRPELLGEPLTVLMPERYRAAHTAALDKVRRTGASPMAGRTFALHGRHADGTEFPITLRLVHWRTGGESYFAGTIHDARLGPAAIEQP